MADAGFIKVQVCYSTIQGVTLLDVQLAAGATLSEAVAQSGILQRHPEIDVTINKVGIYGKLKSADSPLHDGDRVEIYRPLIADPKEARRRRAKKQKSGQPGG
ncbi:RnfH family protein [Undibacterium sp.]|jgi:putative ubiquitin-RnfH superfamily antitoxin RatB of RatAB toxin-antitoxin module|uniref:RnfH family protein n=1 Tax=Undibacterium sp. TaxID=1914977 RepID=UPI002C9D73C8|nr:RnfH family protein [Undibacterium sp.]HTD05703.1 RnfH family protein [Undibacterium sp.]